MNKLNWDAIGITTSLACAIHCAVLPLVISSLPIFGINIIENDMFEYFMIFLAFAVGCIALMHGFRKHHHNIFPLAIFTLGMLFLVAKQIFHGIHIWLLIPSVILIIASHYINFRLCRKADHCHTADCNH
jgi:hypothetical protein